MNTKHEDKHTQFDESWFLENFDRVTFRFLKNPKLTESIFAEKARRWNRLFKNKGLLINLLIKENNYNDYGLKDQMMKKN